MTTLRTRVRRCETPEEMALIVKELKVPEVVMMLQEAESLQNAAMALQARNDFRDLINRAVMRTVLITASVVAVAGSVLLGFITLFIYLLLDRVIK